MHISAPVRAFFQPVDNSPLVVFRIMFGRLVAAESAGAILTGWVTQTFVAPTLSLPFIGFEWLQPLPGYGMYAYYALMAGAGLLIALGWYYRAAVLAFFLLWWGSYLMQKFNYNNHYYLLVLLSWMMVFMPAHCYASLDVRRRPETRSLTCSRGIYWIFIGQVGLVLTYAAAAKLYPDWLAGRPIQLWFGNKSDYPLVGSLLQQPWFQAAVVYGGIAFDFLAAPLLLWSRTRPLGFVLSLGFHGFNAAIFQIGVFPFLMLALTAFFFPPETVRRVFLKRKPPLTTPPEAPVLSARHAGILWIVVAYFLLQLLLPLRHWGFGGNVNWTEEGHRMSWRMMLRSKSGHIRFCVVDSVTGEVRAVSPSDYLTPKQTAAVATHPDMAWQFSRFLKKEFEGKGFRAPRVYALGEASLNGRPYQPLIDSTVDLAAVKWQPFSHAEWILPLRMERR